MIDTIILRIHNISKYPLIYEQFYDPSIKKKAVSQALIKPGDEQYIADNFRNSYIFHDTGRVLPATYRRALDLPSSHYSVSYFLKLSPDYLEMNFSIPKYLYGNNVQQFINVGDQSAKVQFLELIRFINHFFQQHFITPPLPDDVEINRIDFCYNQFFANKDDALAYMEEQNRLFKKNARSSKNKARYYEGESLLYTTRRYSFKVYHKGKEFKKHDFKEIAKDNKKGLDLPYLQSQADNILRYELTLRSSMLNYLVQFYFMTGQTSALDQKYSDHRISKFARSLVLHLGTKAYEKFKDRAKRFTLKSPFDYDLPLEARFNSDSITFDETIFSICYDLFWRKVKDYQLTMLLDVNTVVKRIDDMNEASAIRSKYAKKERGIPRSTSILLTLLANRMTEFEQIKRHIPRRTYFQWQANLKKIGVNATDTHLRFAQPRTDYFDYKLQFLQAHNYIH